MSLIEVVEIVDNLGAEIKVYANNDVVFGFGIHIDVAGVSRQLGYAVFNTATINGLASFHTGGVGVREFNASETDPATAERRFTEALTTLLELH